MNLSGIIEVGIGLVVVYSLFSLACSKVNEFVVGLFHFRARTLERGLRRLLDGSTHRAPATGALAASRLTFEQLLAHQLVVTQQPSGRPPSYMDPATFAVSVMDLLSPSLPQLLDEVRKAAGANPVVAGVLGDPALTDEARVLALQALKAGGGAPPPEPQPAPIAEDTAGDFVTGGYVVGVSGMPMGTVPAEAVPAPQATPVVSPAESPSGMPGAPPPVAGMGGGPGMAGPPHAEPARPAPEPPPAPGPGIQPPPPPQPAAGPGLQLPAGVDALLVEAQALIDQVGSLAQIAAAVSNLPVAHPAKVPLTRFLAMAEGSRDRFIAHLETWFNGAMDRLSGWYKRKSQLFLIGYAIVFVCAFNVDTINIASTLYRSGPLRAAVATAAESTSNITSAQDAIRRATDLNLPLGWVRRSPATVDPFTGIDNANNSLTWPPASQDLPLKLLGLAITVGALAFGATFWFDVLGQVANLRNTGPKPSQSGA